MGNQGIDFQQKITVKSVAKPKKKMESIQEMEYKEPTTF